MSDLENKIALVTGAGKGTGRLVAEALAAGGAQVAANDITPVNLDETVRRIASTGGRVKAYVQDVSKKIPVQALVNMVLDDFGRIDILVNCAEVEPQKSVLEMDEWDWQRTMDVNLSGAFLLTQSVARLMKEKGGGIIIHVGRRATSETGKAAYFASKAGLEAMVQAAAKELSILNIHAFHVQPDVTRVVEIIKGNILFL
jgi:3-oxoacyl-[acyl-carrier protein] reductase